MTAEPGHHDLPVAARVRRLEERVIAAGLASDGELDEALARFYARATPVNGARLVARAWTDPRFRARLLADGSAAAAELGFGPQVSSYQLRVVANSAQRHNVIVCTLCSCYPVALLGPSPSWYKSLAYRSRTVREPRAVLGEFGLVGARRGGHRRMGFHRGDPLPGAARAAGRHGQPGRGRAGCPGHPGRAHRHRPRLRRRLANRAAAEPRLGATGENPRAKTGESRVLRRALRP